MIMLRIAIIILLLLQGCLNFERNEVNVKDIKIFKDTPAWELAKAVENQNVSKINKLISENKEIANYQDPTYGTTLLMRAISSEKYSSAKALLDNQADPDIVSFTGTTALFRAVSHSWSDSKARKDAKFVKLLLDNGADPNISYCAPEVHGETSPIECGTSPLIHAVSRSFTKTKLLVEAGADINYKTRAGKTATIEALLMKEIDPAYYLIVEKKAEVTQPYFFYSLTDRKQIETEKPFYPVDLLLDWVYEIGSIEFSKKMEIVEEFRNQNVDYSKRKKNISVFTLNRIKKMYPSSWEEYIDKY